MKTTITLNESEIKQIIIDALNKDGNKIDPESIRIYCDFISATTGGYNIYKIKSFSADLLEDK